MLVKKLNRAYNPIIRKIINGLENVNKKPVIKSEAPSDFFL